MAAKKLEQSLEFVKELTGDASSVNKCYQCATCSTVCPLSSDGNPFPRKEMIWAQWGQKDKLLADPDAFLCHQCNDCATYCPRDAKPGDVMAAVRKATFAHYAVPGFMGKLFSNVKNLPILLLLPIIIFVLVILLNNALGGEAGYFAAGTAQDPIIYSRFIPQLTGIDMVFGLLVTFAVFTLYLSISKYWQAVKANDKNYKAATGLGASIIETFKDLISHKKFKECGASAGRRIAHLITMFSFVALFLVTAYVVVMIYSYPILGILKNPVTHPIFGNNYYTPLDMSQPPLWVFFKLLGALGSIGLIGGLILLITSRTKSAAVSKSETTTYDWVFLAMFFLLGVTGVFSWVFRVAGSPFLAYSSYFLHLICVFYTLVYLPYSKFAHMVYRFTALVYAKHTGRDTIIPVSKMAAKEESAA